MKISLSTSLHLNHGSMTIDHKPGDRFIMQSFVPVGLLCLKGYLDAAGSAATVRVVETNDLINSGAVPNDEYFYQHLADAVTEQDDDIAGLMTDADSLHHTLLLAQRIKSHNPKRLIVLGGPASSPIARALLESFPFIDFVVRGEGEETFLELVNAIRADRSFEKITGLTWRRAGAVVENAHRPVLPDLDALPLPSFDAYATSNGAALYLDVGRGCPFTCQFCATAPFWERRYRMKSIDRILNELTLLRDKYNRKEINFSHDIFTCDKEWTERFCKRLKDEALGIQWTCSTRTDLIDERLLSMMAAAGCVEIYYGIESGSPEIQKRIHKHLDLKRSRSVVEATVAVGIRPITGFIVGYPMETINSLEETVEAYFDFLDVGGVRAHLFTLCPFQESPMYREYSKQLDRQAQYFDLSLTMSAIAENQRLRRQHPGIFSSSFRYRTPNVPADLIDASEEVSAHLTVLRRIWPYLLKYYSNGLEFYSKWTLWIKETNRIRRPWNSLTCQGTTADLLEFVRSELMRLELNDGPLGELVKYEAMKIEARQLPYPIRESGDMHQLDYATIVDEATRIRVRCGYIARQFQYDVMSMLDLKPPIESIALRKQWVTVAKTSVDNICTMRISEFAKGILDLAQLPIDAYDAIGYIFCGNSANNIEDGIRIVKSLVQSGLLMRV